MNTDSGKKIDLLFGDLTYKIIDASVSIGALSVVKFLSRSCMVAFNNAPGQDNKV